MSHWQLALVSPAALAMLAAAVWDIKTFKIPNQLVLAVLLTAALNAVLAGSLSALGWVGSLTTLVVGLALWRIGQVGAGDVKFAAAVLLWLPGRAIDFIVLTSLLGLLTALIFLVRAKTKKSGDRRVPYGPPIAAAAIFLLAMGVFRG